MNKSYKEERSDASFKEEMVKWYINQLYSEKYLNYQEALFLINNANHQWLKALESAFLK